VQTLAGNAAHTVLFPRPELQKDMLELVGIDITAHPERHTIVAEGIDLDVIDRAVVAAAEFAAGVEPVPPLAALEALLAGLPEKRRGLPLMISVGRLHRVKGMATIVDAWANGPLRDRANLLIVGGDLAESSVDEKEQLALIDARIAPADRLASGLLLPGHQPNDTVAHWVAAARFGVPGFAAPAGIYVCGSLKEEFGIALLEAMASGLIVVAPDGGGPATYVEQGVTGFLTRTWHVGDLANAMLHALDAAALEASDERAQRSRATVEKSFTIQAMARALAAVYTEVQAQEDGLRPAPLASR
jgi:glycosyltransferase involved in cell wall biosynthesis